MSQKRINSPLTPNPSSAEGSRALNSYFIVFSVLRRLGSTPFCVFLSPFCGMPLTLSNIVVKGAFGMTIGTFEFVCLGGGKYRSPSAIYSFSGFVLEKTFSLGLCQGGVYDLTAMGEVFGVC